MTVRGLALTFDDGPDPDWTELLLDRLADLQVQVTFFPVAPRASAEPRLIVRMLDAGHSVGLHCCEHVRHSDRDEAWLRQDTTSALALLASLGVEPRLWRTPWGDTAAWTKKVAQEHGLELIGWTVDTHDWRGDGAETMFAATRSELTPGAIVLAHDGIGPGARRETPAETLGYVDRVAAFAVEHGLLLEPLKPTVLQPPALKSTALKPRALEPRVRA